MNSAPQVYLIGQLAKGAGVKPDTIRFYEKQGLMPKPSRTAVGYRVYDEAALKQLRFIRQAQSLGFSLPEIRRILQMRGAGKTTCRCVMGIAEATLTETEHRLAQLEEFRDALRKTLTRWKKLDRTPGRMAAEFCTLIESTGSPAGPSAATRPALLDRQRLRHG